jgi:hypothetical protein
MSNLEGLGGRCGDVSDRFFFSELALIMGAKLHGLRVAVWGEAPETPEERKVCPMLYS